MFLTNAWLTYRQSFLATVAQSALAGDELVVVNSTKSVKLPVGYVLKFQSVNVQTTDEVLLPASAPVTVPCVALLAPISSGVTNLTKVNGTPKEQWVDQIVSSSVEESNRPAPEGLPGVDRSAVYLTGRTVNPFALQDWQRVQDIVPMRFKRGQNSELAGLFYMLPTTQSRLGLDSVFGDPIQGWLQEVKK